jgi:phosphate transport system substrate-binding protein
MPARRAVVLLSFLLFACDRETPRASAKDDAKPVALTGAGATFPFPLYSKWISEYNRLYPNVRINYQSIGSGGGIRQIVAETVDFGATDTPVKEDEARTARGRLLHVPTAIGSVVVTYNLHGLTRPLRLTPEILTAIFLGDITNWNAPAIAETNPDAQLPDTPILVIFRADGSGTTSVFTEYLAGVSPAFRQRVGAGRNVNWPAGLGAKGNEGVTGQVKSVPGAIGYTELAYATQNGLPRAELRNRSGRFVGPAHEAATAAAESVPMPESLHVSLASAASESAYPLAAYTYVLVYENAKDLVRGKALARFLWWAIHDGQRYTADLDYAPLPKNVIEQAEAALLTLRAGGRPLLGGT